MCGLAAGGLGLCPWGQASASTVSPVPLNALVWKSEHILVGVPQKGESVWENTAGGSRIATYTRVAIVQPIDGRSTAETSILVRTLGGRVGDVGQIVNGEAELERDRPAVFFLRRTGDSLFALTAMAQGHYPLTPDSQRVPRLSASPKLAQMVAEVKEAAVVRLSGTTVTECEQLVWQELK
jgi:hypothetical protein